MRLFTSVETFWITGRGRVFMCKTEQMPAIGEEVLIDDGQYTVKAVELALNNCWTPHPREIGILVKGGKK